MPGSGQGRLRLRHLLALALLFCGMARAGGIDGGLVPPGHIFRPAGPGMGMVVLFSGETGWGPGETRLSERLAAQGVIVLGVDLPRYFANIAGWHDACAYLVADIEGQSRKLQRAAGEAPYETPVIAGIGMGGGVALDIITQTPPATIAATVVADPVTAVPFGRPLCTTSVHQATPAGDVYDLPGGALANPVSILLTGSAAPDIRARAGAFRYRADPVRVEEVAGAAEDALLAALTGTLATVRAAARALPAVILPAGPRGDTMAVIVSGDGGWRDIDRQLADRFQAAGVPVVGLDALRYFWSLRQPAELARDLALMIEAQAAEWGTGRVLLVGFSFGANVLPETWPLLPQAVRDRVRLVSLLAPSEKADWQITVSGWLGSESAAARPTGPALAAMPQGLIQCIYGAEDATGSACPGLDGTGAEVTRLPGGHHFDGDYDALAARILAAAAARP